MAAVLIEKQVSLLFSSDVLVGAQNVSSDGSRFEVTLDEQINVPSSAMSCQACTIAATIAYTSPNISQAFNNNGFRYTTSTIPAGTFDIVIPDGLYGLDELDSFLSTQFVNNGHRADLFNLSGDGATQSTVITIAVAGDSCDLTLANSVGPILGWPSPGAVVTAPPPPVDDYSAYSPSEATFNRISSYAIKSSLFNTGVSVNGNSRSVIASIPVTVFPGSQISYLPSQPQWFDASELIGNPRQNMSFELLDQDLRPAPTNDDPWSVTVLLKWNVLLSSKPVPMRP